MPTVLSHPAQEELELGQVMGCLSDPIRLAIVAKLADMDGDVDELRCRDFSDLGGKSKLSYHFDTLRKAGVVAVRLVGTSRYLRVRRPDLDARFPGLLSAVLASKRKDDERTTLVD